MKLHLRTVAMLRRLMAERDLYGVRDLPVTMWSAEDVFTINE